jgi:hypothetical protein
MQSIGLHALSAVNRIRGFLIGFTDHACSQQPARTSRLARIRIWLIAGYHSWLLSTTLHDGCGGRHAAQQQVAGKARGGYKRTYVCVRSAPWSSRSPSSGCVAQPRPLPHAPRSRSGSGQTPIVCCCFFASSLTTCGAHVASGQLVFIPVRVQRCANHQQVQPRCCCMQLCCCCCPPAGQRHHHDGAAGASGDCGWQRESSWMFI